MSKLNPKQAEEKKWEDFEQKSKKVETENHFQWANFIYEKLNFKEQSERI